MEVQNQELNLNQNLNAPNQEPNQGNALQTETKPPIRDKRGRFLPGHGAPGPGRPKGSVSLTTMARKMLEEIPPGERMTRAEAFLKRVFTMAIENGNEQIIKLIWNYVDGMPKQRLEMGGQIEHRENRLYEFLKNAPKEKRKKFVDELIGIIREGKQGGDL